LPAKEQRSNHGVETFAFFGVVCILVTMNELEAGRISYPLYRTASSLRRLRTSGHGTNSSFLCPLQSWVAGLHPSQSAGWRPYAAALMALVKLFSPNATNLGCFQILPRPLFNFAAAHTPASKVSGK